MKKVIAFGMSMMISVGCMSSVYATDDVLTYDASAGKIVTDEEAMLIEEKLAEISKLELQRNNLVERIEVVAVKSYCDKDEIEAEIASIDNEISVLNQEIYELGATTLSDNMLEKLISNKARVAHPSEYVEVLEDKYTVVAYTTFGENLQQQYHILLKPKNDPDFTQNGAVLVFGENTSNAIKQDELVNATLSLSADWVLSNVGGGYAKFFDIMPWELIEGLFSEAETVSCDDVDSMTAQYGMISQVKFVFVLDDDGYWKLGVSTSRVFCYYELRTRILVDNSEWEFFNLVSADGLEIAGDFYNAKEDAAEAIANGGIPKNTCIKEWRWDYKKRVNGKTTRIEVVELYLPAPDSIWNLLYQ